MSLSDYFTQTLKKDEAVVTIIRKHWITYVIPLSISLVVIGVIIGFVDYFFRSSAGAIVWFAIFGFALAFAAYHWVIHYFDSFIITDLRIIDIDQNGLFKRTVSETTFDKVQDVTYSIVGILATGLDYGTVSVQTGGAEGKIELDHVPHPRKVHEIVLEAQKLFKDRHGGDMSAQELIELIARVKGGEQGAEAESSDTDEGES